MEEYLHAKWKHTCLSFIAICRRGMHRRRHFTPGNAKGTHRPLSVAVELLQPTAD